MAFKIEKKQVKPFMFKKVIKEIPDEKPYSHKKYQLRYKINKEVFDLHDSVADNAKMISLIFALLTRIWEAIPNDIKDKMDKETREMVEYAFQKYHSIQTRADVEFLINGKELIDKLMDRQDKIGKLFKEIYGIEK